MIHEIINEKTCLKPVNTVLPAANEQPVMATTMTEASGFPTVSAVLPADLTGLDRWVAHRSKVPVDCHTGIAGNVTDSATWVSYEEARAFTAAHPETGLGFVLNGDGIVGIDIDHCLVDGKVAEPQVQAILNRVKSYSEISPSGSGLHIYVRGQWPEGARNKIKLDDGIAVEVYNRNRYFTVTGNRFGESTEVTGDQNLLDYLYEEFFKRESDDGNPQIEPLQLNMVEIPPNIMDHIARHAEESAVFAGLWSGTDRSDDESSDDMRLLCRLAPLCDYNPDVMAAAFMASPYAKLKDQAHLKKLQRPDYIGRSISKALQYVAEHTQCEVSISNAELLDFEFNDYGNARRLLSLYQGKVLYDPASANWLLYDNGRWKPDNKRKEGMYRVANELYCTLESLLYQVYADDVREADRLDEEVDADEEKDADESENEEAEFYREQRAKFIKLQKEVRKLGNHATQRNMLNSAATQGGGAGIEFNCHNHLLVVQNGTVDLRTGNLLPHVPGYYITMRADVKYDPAAQEPKRFLQFLNEIFDNNQELIDYVHRLLGYCLTGETREHVFHVLHGEGANGKSVLINLLCRMFSEYCKNVSAGALERHSDNDRPNPSLLQAKDARIIVVNETNEGVKLNSALIKQISAGDEICPRALFQDNEHFIPHMQILWVTNHIPQIDWNDGGIRRRYKLIPFTRTFAPDKQDRDLPEKLWAEREGILKWLIEGAIEWYAQGLGDLPDAMANALEQERRNEDSVYAFFQDEIVVTNNPEDEIQAKALYDAYLEYCVNNEIDYPQTNSKMGLKLPKLGILKRKLPRFNVYVGIKLRELEV